MLRAPRPHAAILVLPLALVFCLSLPNAYGQLTTYGQIVGRVIDQTGAVVPGVEITVTNTETNVPRSTVSNDTGNYLVDKLIAGVYEARAELPGFKTHVAEVRLNTGQVARLDFLLSPGEISEQVTVMGQTTALDTDTADISTTLDETQITELPINDRNLILLAELSTGSVSVRFSTDPRFVRDSGGLPAVNGLRPDSSQIMLDGAGAQRLYDQRATVNPTPETIKQFKVISNTFSAEYGRVGGAVVSMTSHSGSNEFHGFAWEYLRNETFDANGFFANRTGLGKLPLSRHTFGGAVGGPIIKDKTFFYASYERFMDESNLTGFMDVPPASELAGNFGQGDGKQGLIPIYDPFNVVDGQRVQFPNNVIPSSRIHPVSLAVRDKVPWPAPNQTTYPNYAYPHVIDQVKNKISIRGDHHFGDDSTLFGRWTWQNDPQISHGSASAGSFGFFVGRGRLGVPGMRSNVYEVFTELETGWQTSGGWVKPVGSNLVNEINFTGWKSDFGNNSADTVDWFQEFGYDLAGQDGIFAIGNNGQRGPADLPSIGISGYSNIQGQGEFDQGDWGFSIKETASWRKGDHYLKLGIETVRNMNVRLGWVRPGASIGFNGYQTGQITYGPDGSITGSTFGQPYADFLLGTVASAQSRITGGAGYGLGNWGGYNQSSYSWFINDDWKVMPDLSLNLGLRHEIPLPEHWLENKGNCFIDVTGGRDNPIHMVPKGFPYDSPLVTNGQRDALVVPVVELDSHRCRPVPWQGFAPRVGIAWRMFGTNRTVLRAGGGMSFDQEYGGWKVGVGWVGPYVGTVRGIQPRGEAPQYMHGSFLNLPTTSAARVHSDGSYSYDGSGSQTGQVYSYNLSIQHELFDDTKVEIAYVGNQGRHMRNHRAWNVSQIAGQPIILNTGETIRAEGNRDQRRPYPLIATTLQIRFDGSQNYNSLQAKIERMPKDGLGISAGWTYGRVFATNYAGTYIAVVPNEFDRTGLNTRTKWDRLHSYYTALTWRLPILGNATGLTKTLLAGWEATSVITAATGSPFGVRVGRDVNDIGSRRLLMPDRLSHGQLPESQRTVDRYYDVGAFAIPAVGRFGNSHMWPLEGDGISVFDIGLHKGFAIGEDKELDFRVEMFNAFNHPIFDTPGGKGGQDAIEGGGAGRVSSASQPRRLQFAFRFSF